MTKLRRVFLALLAVGIAGSARGGDALPLEVALKVKAATAFVRTTDSAAEVTGSAFLFHVAQGKGRLLTCEHVVGKAKALEVVFGSGTAGEKVLEAKVVCRDPDLDLACLEVDGAGLPAPLPLLSRTEVRETEDVFVAGYPFGMTVIVNGKNPEMALAGVSVSSLRAAPGGELALIQLSGDVNPGNSGGPVVDARGKVTGIAQSKIEMTQTSFAVAAEAIHRFILGRSGKVSFSEKVLSADRTEVTVSVELLDPMGGIRSARLLLMRQDAFDRTDAKSRPGVRLKGLPGVREVALSVQPGANVATGVFVEERGKSDPVSIYLACQCITEAEAAVVTGPVRTNSVSFQLGEGASSGSGPAQVDVAKGAAEIIRGKARQGDGASYRDLFLSRDGKTLYALDLSGGRILKWRCPELAPAGEVRVQEDCIAMAMSPDGRHLFVIARRAKPGRPVWDSLGSIQRVDAVSMKADAPLEIPEQPSALACVADGRVAVFTIKGSSRLFWVDPSKREVTPFPATLSETAEAHVHPDQTRLYYIPNDSDGNIHRVPTRGGNEGVRRYLVRQPNPGSGWMPTRFTLTPDGRHLICGNGALLRCAKPLEDDLALESVRVDPHRGAAFASGPGLLFLACVNGVVRIYRTDRFEFLRAVTLDVPCREIAVDPSGAWLYAVTIRKESQQWHELNAMSTEIVAYPLSGGGP